MVVVPFYDLIGVLPVCRHLLLERIADEDEILEARELVHVLKLTPFSHQIVGHVQN